MTLPSLIVGAPRWWAAAAAVGAVTAAVLAWSYVRARSRPLVRAACALLKASAIALLALILLEPLLVGTRPRRGANAFAVAVDNSQSLSIRDNRSTHARADWIRDQVRQGTPWQVRLGQDFDVHNYVFDSHIRAVDGFDALAFDGTGSAIGGSLNALAKRFRGRPLAGVLLFTDGNRTDLGDIDGSKLPPIYPVLPPSRGTPRDVGIRDVAISQTNFESAPVVLNAELATTGFAGEPIVVRLLDEAGREVERQTAKAEQDGKPLNVRFRFRPPHKGVSIYSVQAFPASEGIPPTAGDTTARSSEQTLANNSRLVVVDQGSGPYRILYVGGRPNWEFKFLRRALYDDEQLQLVGLLRIAKRQPKFDFQAAGNRSTSPLFDGFEHPDSETAEAADQAVLVRLGTKDEAELRDGFPKSADDLYQYHALIIDDIEANFFTADQLALIRSFVSVRGGGLLMLGGPDSFTEGKYDRTAVGELLPIYLNGRATSDESSEHHLVLTREGWLQPWVRTRQTEDEEQKRLTNMPGFQVLSRVGPIKPGAVTLAEVTDDEGNPAPALVAQTFGKGHVAALMIGDLWRWSMRRESAEERDLERSWRQTARWLVSDVPNPVDVAVRPKADSLASAVEVSVRVRDPEYQPLDNAKVTIAITPPSGEPFSLEAVPDAQEPGLYACSYVPREPGAYRALATAAGADGTTVGAREAGFAAQPAADEFARLEPDREFLDRIARSTGGEVIDGDKLASVVNGLPARGAPVTEPWTAPLWHNPAYFLAAILCLTAEWGLRRVNGLP